MWDGGGSKIVCYYSYFTSKVVGFGSTKTLKLADLLFRETTKTNLFVQDSVETNFGSFDTNRFSQDTLSHTDHGLKRLNETANAYRINLRRTQSRSDIYIQN